MPFSQIWSESKDLTLLRDMSSLKGKCGACAYKNVCGGCRARAYEIKDDIMDTDPICWYKQAPYTGNDSSGDTDYEA